MTARSGGISYSTLFLLAVYAAAFAVLNLSRWGRSFYATGENAVAALYSGINVRGYVLAAFVICAVMMVFAATLVIAQGGRSEPIAGNGFLMSAYASVLLGAALFERPGVIPTFAGTLLISMILNGFTLISVPYYWSNAVVSSVLILGVVVFDSRTGGSVRRALSRIGAPRRDAANASSRVRPAAGEPAE